MNYKQLYSEKVPYIFPKISYYLSRRGGSYFFQKSVTILQGKGVGHLFFQKPVTILQRKGGGSFIFPKTSYYLAGGGWVPREILKIPLTLPRVWNILPGPPPLGFKGNVKVQLSQV